MKELFGLFGEMLGFGSFLVRSSKEIGEDLVGGAKGFSKAFREIGEHTGKATAESLKQDLAELTSGLPEAE